jgi:hypothetical protein
MSDKIYIQLSVFGLIYLAILFVTMVVTFIPITIWWLFTGHMVSNLFFLKICGLATTIIFAVSVLIGMVSHKK